MMLPYTRFSNTTSGSPLDSTWNLKNRNHANIQESHVKWIKIRMMHVPNPPSRPQWTGKQSLLTADNCTSGSSSFCRQNSNKQNLVQIQESQRNRPKTATLKRTRSQAVARIADRTAKNSSGHVTAATSTFREFIYAPARHCPHKAVYQIWSL